MWYQRTFGMAGAILVSLIPSSEALFGQATTQSPHERLPEGLTCLGCHTTAGWSPLRDDLEFDHGDDVGFELDGQHAGLACVTCHATARFDEVAAAGDCASCHLDVHQAAFDRGCVECHTTESFSVIESWAVHPTDYPLEGAHLQVTCESCHTDDLGGAYVPLEAECEACHMDAYASTVLIDHEALAFPTECTQCHDNFAWRDIPDWDHTVFSGGFELGGTHIGLECTACHSGPGAEVPNTPVDAQDCVACHLSDYQDQHGGSGLPTECTQCHTETTWSGATFDHPYFPIYSGAHKGKWNNDCATCHTVPADKSSFTCFQCHQHDQIKMDEKHSGEPGYVYESSFCYSCHTDGRK